MSAGPTSTCTPGQVLETPILQPWCFGSLTRTLPPTDVRPSGAGGGRAEPHHHHAGAPRCAQLCRGAPGAPGLLHPRPGGCAGLCECLPQSPAPGQLSGPGAGGRAAGLLLTQPLSLQVDPSHQPSGRLRHWLHKLQVALRAVSQASGVTALGVYPHFSADPSFLPAAGEHREHGVPEGHHHPPRLTSAGQPALRGPPGQVLKRPEAPAHGTAPKGRPEDREERRGCTSYLTLFLTYASSGSIFLLFFIVF